MSHKVCLLSLDLSKSSTGFCLTLSEYQESKKAWLVEKAVSGSISAPPQSQHTYKHPHVAVRAITNELDTLLHTHQREGYQTQVALEHPIFNSYSSPLQFYLHQAILDYLDQLHFNVVAYSTGMLKSFMAGLTNTQAKSLDKKAMQSLYPEIYPKLPKALKDPSRLTSHDELDAILLNLIGLSSQALPISTIHRLCPTHESLHHRFTKSSEIYRTVFLSQGAKPWLVSEDSDVQTDISKLIKQQTRKLKDNQHLSLESKLFFPYQALYQTSEWLNSLLFITPKEGRNSLLESLKLTFKMSRATQESLLTQELPRSVYCDFNGDLHINSPHNLKGL